MSTAAASRTCGSTIHFRPLGCGLAAAALLLAGASPAAAATQDRYGYYRVVDGSANVVQQGSNQAAQENQPLLTGDRLRTSRGSRVEVVLADGTVLRVEGDSEIAFEQLADSGDTYADSNLLTFARGELQLVGAGSAETRVDTDNSSVYLRDAGSYRIETRDNTTVVLVRSGSAEVRTRRGATVVRKDEEAWIEGDGSPDIGPAGSWDSLERWASSLDDEYRTARGDDDYVDGSLGYSASRMSSYGSWVTYGSRRAWRPRVGVDWSPYRHGRWVYTPSGLTWVSYEPWGWVPYHYGSWDYAPGWGWMWYPGRSYAPAWVYWYWGPTHVGWCPIGYYSHYYGPRFYGRFGFDFTFRFGFGVHGWAGGSRRHFDRWTFVDCHNLYDRRLGYFARNAVQLGGGSADLPRGIITTQTRGLGPAIATRPSGGMQRLANGGGGWTKPLRDLPDVSRFVARDPNLGADVGRIALPVGTGDRGNLGASGRDLATRPGGKPGLAGGDADGRGGASSRDGFAIDMPGGNDGWRNGSGGTAGPGGADGSGVRGARPREGSGDAWRNGGGGQGRDAGGTKPDFRPRPDGATGAAPGSTPGARVKPRNDGRDDGSPSGGPAARSASPRGDDAWRGGGGSSSPGARLVPRERNEQEGTSSRGATERSPRGGDESWRASGRDGTGAAARSAVRRIVEGMRSNRQEPAQPDTVRGGIEKPGYDPGTRRAEPPPSYEPRPSQRSAPPARPAADRPRGTESPPESYHARPSDSGGRGAADRGDRGGRSGGDRGDRGSHGGDRGGARTRPSGSGSNEGGDPNR